MKLPPERDSVLFNVRGNPAPKGSMRGFVRWRATAAGDQATVGLKPDNRRTASWTRAVAAAARLAMRDRPPWPAGVGVALEIAFLIPRPRGHYGKRGTVLPSAPALPLTRRGGGGDLDKLVRTVLDALAGQVYVDDSQVVRIATKKLFANAAGWPTGGVEIYAHTVHDSTEEALRP